MITLEGKFTLAIAFMPRNRSTSPVDSPSSVTDSGLASEKLPIGETRRKPSSVDAAAADAVGVDDDKEEGKGEDADDAEEDDEDTDGAGTAGMGSDNRLPD